MSFHASTFRIFVGASILAASLSGCGWRTALDTGSDPEFEDGGTSDGSTFDMSRPDMGRVDMGGRDGGTDMSIRDMGVDAPVCFTNFDCNDGDICNGDEACVGGRCVSGPAPVCDDGVSCTHDFCDGAAGGCVSTADNSLCPDGICIVGVGCESIPCMLDEECDDGLGCNGGESCVDNICRGGPPPCGVSDDCTTVSCVEAGGSASCAVLDRSDVDMDSFASQRCGGDDCNDGNANINPGRMEACSDGVDNNCNLATDCADAACVGTLSCMMPTCPTLALGSATGPAVASGTTIGRPDDFDESCVGSSTGNDITYSWTAPMSGFYTFDTTGSSFDTVLALFASCDGPELECDDDGGGGGSTSSVARSFSAGESVIIIIDGFSGGSRGDYTLSITLGLVGVPEIGHCHDGVDNDGNGFTDCADFACRGEPGCCMGPGCGCAPSEDRCGNGSDDDCDGLTDCEDTVDCCDRFACRGTPFCATADAGVDAGRDGGVDAGMDAGGADGGMMCLPRENSVALCTDGVDDDCDTRTDCSDTDCRPFGPGSECCNGLDDDGDGTVDLFTCRCFDDSECVGVGDFEQVCWVTDFHVCGPRCNFVGGSSFCSDMLGEGFVCNAMTGECVGED